MIPFSTTLCALRGGGCHDDMAQALREATKAVHETGNKATVTLKIIVEPNGENNEGVSSVLVRDEISTKIPKPSTRASVFFITDGNDLARQLTIPGVEETQKAPARAGKE
jgi:hypothetical protein